MYSLMLALSIEHFGEPEDFMALADELRENAHRIRPAEGQDLVLLPGEPEERVTRQRQREGIPLPERTWSMLQELAAEWGVEPLVSDH